jgi:ABC-type multidrug transport system fused ATPase/permease subunit
LAEKRIQDKEDFHKGEILLDGVNIENVGLHHLRRSCGMIPQDPVLFRGTIRTNIDPLNEYKDEEVGKIKKKKKIFKYFKIFGYINFI